MIELPALYPIRVNVTALDIAYSVPFSDCACAISRAIRRMVPRALKVKVIVGLITIIGPAGQVCEIKTTPEINSFILRIDNGHHVKPFEFVLEIPAAAYDWKGAVA